MKKMITLINILAVVGTLLYAWILLIKGLGPNLSGSSSFSGTAFWIAVGLVVASIYFSRTMTGKPALLWACAPMAWLVVLIVFTLVSSSLKSHPATDRELSSTKARTSVTESNERFASLTRDYVCEVRNKSAGVLESFYTVDNDLNVVADVTAYEKVGTIFKVIGKIDGKKLGVYDKELTDMSQAPTCLDREGKTILDTYTVVDRSAQEYWGEQTDMDKAFNEKYR